MDTGYARKKKKKKTCSNAASASLGKKLKLGAGGEGVLLRSTGSA
jgi:hypothetical protein